MGLGVHSERNWNFNEISTFKKRCILENSIIKMKSEKIIRINIDTSNYMRIQYMNIGIVRLFWVL